MILSCCSIAFRDEPIEDVVKRYAEIGYDAVEILGRQIENNSEQSLRDLRKLADDRGIKLLVVSPYFILTRNRQHFDESMKTAEWSVNTAHILGATKIRTFTDVAGDGIGSDAATSEHWDQAVEGLQRICAMDRQIEFVVETHPHTLADQVDSIEQLFSRVNQPNLKLNFQPTAPTIAHGLNRAFDRLKDLITHMHLHQLKSDGQGTYVDEPGEVDFPDFTTHIKQGGYAHSISVEYCWKNVPWEKVESAHGYMRSLLA